MTDSPRDRVIAACSAKSGSVEDYPFGDEAPVFKIAGKLFILVALGPRVRLKCIRISRPGRTGQAEHLTHNRCRGETPPAKPARAAQNCQL
jgi:hypothetical protein